MRMCRLRVAAACSCNTGVMHQQQTNDRLPFLPDACRWMQHAVRMNSSLPHIRLHNLLSLFYEQQAAYTKYAGA